MYLKWVLATCKTCQFITLQGNINFQFRSFSEYCYLIGFVHDISCSSKGCLIHDTNVHETFSALDLIIIFTKPWNSVTFSVSFLNEISFLHYILLNTPSLTAFQNLMNFKPLTNWLSKHSEVIFFPKCFHLLLLCGELTLIFVLFVFSEGNTVLADSL